MISVPGAQFFDTNLSAHFSDVVGRIRRFGSKPRHDDLELGAEWTQVGRNSVRRDVDPVSAVRQVNEDDPRESSRQVHLDLRSLAQGFAHTHGSPRLLKLGIEVLRVDDAELVQ
jgi:hypothetical protein